MKYLDCKGGVVVIYTDFEKAFDKVYHQILLFNLKGMVYVSIHYVGFLII